MANAKDRFTTQLKQASKLSGARWVVWLKRTHESWSLDGKIALSQAKRAALLEFIRQPQTALWLAGAFNSGHTRSRATGPFSTLLGCRRVFVFANLEALGVVIVGADQLSSEQRGFFRVIALGAQSESANTDFPLIEQSIIQPALQSLETNLGMSFNPDAIFDWTLNFLRMSIPCDAAYLAIRIGEYFRVVSCWNYGEPVVGREISVPEDNILSGLTLSQQGLALQNITEPPRFLLQEKLPKKVKSAMGLPVVLGQRLIGLVVFVAYKPQALKNAGSSTLQDRLFRVAHALENAIVYSDIARYLQQFELISELAAAVSSGIDTDEFARRIVRRLRRTFRTDLTAILLLSMDRKMLREYSGVSGRKPLIVPVKTSLAGFVVESGYPIRVGDINKAPRYLDEGFNVRSALVVPLKYGGKAIGTISVESTESSAFTSQDEQLLIVIASHLAGLLFNVRLHQETRERARNLSLIYQVLQSVVGLTDIQEIAQVTVELMAEYFNYELALIMLLEEGRQELVNLGLAGNKAHLVERGFRLSSEQGISGRVLRSGKSHFTNNTSFDSDMPSPDIWQAGSEICVPLKDGERNFGVLILKRNLKNAFSENDLSILESLAAILSSVMVNAFHNQQMEARLNHLQGARETALDISGDLEQEILFQRVVARARDLVGVQAAALGLVDQDRNSIRVVLSKNPWSEELEQCVPPDSGILGQVVKSGTAMVFQGTDPWSSGFEIGLSMPVTAALAVPLKFKNEIEGALAVLSDQPAYNFQDEDRQLLELLAPQIVVAIHNARLYRQLAERIEAQRRAEKQLIQSARMAAVGQMAAGIAHELNNPLTTISGFVEMALENLPGDDPLSEDLRTVLSESRRARDVVRRLLNFARQTENLRSLKDLNQLVREVVLLIQHQAQNDGIHIQTELAEGLPFIAIDPNQIKQVCLNLVQNALQAMPEGGYLFFITGQRRHQKREGLVLAIRDTGNGIPSENLERIFDPFFTTRPIGEGTGLGLSVSYGIVTEHGGFVDVESAVGRGSCFTVWLPLEVSAENA